MTLETFEDVRASMDKDPDRPFHLLLGNGFSMAYDPNIFSYRALHEFVVNLNDPVLKRLFEVVDTRDFEMVLKQLETLVSLGGALGLDKEAIRRIEEAMTSLLAPPKADLPRPTRGGVPGVHRENSKSRLIPSRSAPIS